MDHLGTYYSNMAVTKTYSVDAVTVNLIAKLAKRLSTDMGRNVSQGEVVRIAAKRLDAALDEEEAAEAEAERDEYELEEAAAEAGYE